MKNRVLLIIVLIIGFVGFINCNQQKKSQDQLGVAFPKLKGPYLGQKTPGMIPEVFAKGIVSTGRHEHSFPSFSPDGNQVLWTSIFQDNSFEFPVRVISSQIINGVWSEPDFFQNIPLSHSYEAFFAPDGERIYFTSTVNGFGNENSKGKQDIWYIEKSETGWMSPKNIGLPINSSNIETKPTLTKNMTLYYLGHYEGGKNNYGIYKSELIDGIYQQPELLPENINTEYVDWTPFIDPDEDYLLFSSTRPGGYGSGDLYISFRNPNDTWTDPINLGSTINGNANERYPYVSPDGKYLFFVSDKIDEQLEKGQISKLKDFEGKFLNSGNGWCDIYWVEAKVIEDLRPKNLK